MNKKQLEVQIGKTYLTKHGRFVKIVSEPWAGIFNGEYEEDGRGTPYGRWLTDGVYRDHMFGGHVISNEQLNFVMEDCQEAREIAHKMLLERKQKAYEEAK
jgi:hypothetical protein